MTDKFRLSMALFIVSEAVFFVVLILAYIYYHNSPANRNGPSAFNSPEVVRIAIFSACMYASSVTVYLAGRGHRRGDDRSWLLWLLLTIGLGAAFLYGEATEYAYSVGVLGLKPETNVFGSTYYALTGFHGLHVFAGLAMLLILFGLTLGGYLRAGRRPAAVDSISLYWQFDVAVWVVLFPLIYLWSLAGPGPR